MIYLDIETIPSENKPERATAPKTLKKAESIEAYETDPAHIEAEWRKQALKPMQGTILCIGLAVNNEDPVVLFGDEERIITEFANYCDENEFFCGHNIKGFDLPFLRYKGFKYDVPLYLPYKRYDQRAEDTMEIWAGTDWQNKTSLANIAKFLGIECKSTMKGSEVYDYWQEGRLQDIYDYCKEDVEVTREVYRRIAL